MGSMNGRPPIPGGLDYFAEDLAVASYPDHLREQGYAEMLTVSAPASRPGVDNLRVSPLASHDSPDFTIDGTPAEPALRVSAWQQGQLYSQPTDELGGANADGDGLSYFGPSREELIR